MTGPRIAALALFLSGAPAPVDVAARVDRVVARLEQLEDAARRLDEAELQLATARSSAERREAWRAWRAARTDLTAAVQGRR